MITLKQIMNVFDIILAIPLIYAAYRGFRDGVIVQLGGIVGLLIGVWLAFRYCDVVGEWLKLDSQIATPVAFLLIVVAVIIAIGAISWILGKVFNMVGLGVFNKSLGVVLSILKMTLILSVLLMAFEAINEKAEMVSPNKTKSSLLYNPIQHVGTYMFPYVDFLKNKIMLKNDTDE